MTMVILMVVAASFAIAGAVAAVVAMQVRSFIVGPPVLMSPRCANCGSQLRGAGHSLPAACQECGRTTDGPLAVRRTRPSRVHDRISALRRAFVSLAALVVVIMGVSVAALGSVALTQRVLPRLQRPVSTLPSPSPASPTSLQDALLRWARGETESHGTTDPFLLTRPDTSDRTDDLRTYIDSLLEGSHLPDRRSVLAAAAVELARRDPTIREALRTSIQNRVASPRCIAPRRVTPGSEIVVILVQSTRSPDAWLAIEEVRLNGQPLDLKSSQATVGKGLLATGVSSTAYAMVSTVAPLVPGTYSLEIDWSSDWPIPGPNDVPTIPGMHPNDRAEHRTLVVAAGPETVDAVADASSLTPSLFAQTPYLVLISPVFDGAGRHGAWVRFPTVPFGFDGTWSMQTPPEACDDGTSALQPTVWSPLRNLRNGAEPLDIIATGLVPDPRLLDAEMVRVRFEPARRPFVLPSPVLHLTQKWGGTPGRALDSFVQEPLDFIFRRDPLSGSKFLLEEIQPVAPSTD